MDTRFAGSAYRYFLLWGILASLTVTICSIVDSLFIGNLAGSDGLAVANLSTPAFLLYASLGITIGVGANVQIGRLLGSSDVNGANALFHCLLSLGLLAGLLTLCPIFFKSTYFRILGVTEELYPLAEQYITVVMWSAPIFVLYHILSVSVRTDSDPKLATIASFVVIGTNLTLDIVFMKVLGWGIIGASASLCIAETLGVVTLLTHFFKKYRLLTLGLALPRLTHIRDFISNGFGIGSASIFIANVMRVFNALLLHSDQEMGTAYVGIYCVIYTISMIPVGVFDGTSNALSTVTAFLVGESQEEGIFDILKKALLAALIGGGAIALLWAVFSDVLAGLFGIRDAAALESAASAMRIFSISIVFTGINTVITAFWQSIGRARLAGFIALLRYCPLLLAAGAWLIPQFCIKGLSLAYICTEVICTLIIFAVLFLRSSRNYVSEKYGLKGKCFERSYIIQAESMTRISEDLEALCEEWEIGMKQAFLINFISEEMLLNIIKFGLAEQNRKPEKSYISIRLMEKEGDYVLRIRDNISLYNPFESDGDQIDAGVLKLIQKKTKYCDYQRKLIFNYLYVIL